MYYLDTIRKAENEGMLCRLRKGGQVIVQDELANVVPAGRPRSGFSSLESSGSGSLGQRHWMPDGALSSFHEQASGIWRAN